MNNWQKNFKEEFSIHFKNSSDELKFALSFIEDLLKEQRQEIVEKIEEMKIKPHSYQIPCPEGKVGCLVIHWSSDLILTPEDREWNEALEELKQKLTKK